MYSEIFFKKKIHKMGIVELCMYLFICKLAKTFCHVLVSLHVNILHVYMNLNKDVDMQKELESLSSVRQFRL